MFPYLIHHNNAPRESMSMRIAPQRKLELLMEYADREGRTPSRNHQEIFRIGQFWHDISSGGQHRDLLPHLIANRVLREDWENRFNCTVSTEDKVYLLRLYAHHEERAPPRDYVEMYGRDGMEVPVQVGRFWHGIKSGGRHRDLLEDLLTVGVLREDYERTMCNAQ